MHQRVVDSRAGFEYFIPAAFEQRRRGGGAVARYTRPSLYVLIARRVGRSFTNFICNHVRRDR